MSRDKFEAWFYGFFQPREWEYIDAEKCYSAWLAGRESMRHEAADKFRAARFVDFEHGVNNERESQEFKEKYPFISEFGEWINKVKP